MSELTLRCAEPDDGATIARIQLAAWQATYGHLNQAMVDGLDPARTADNWARAAVDPAHRLCLAQCEGTTIGYAASGPVDGDPGIGELHAVYLLPSAQGLGAGGLLVRDALTWLATAGYPECVLWVADENTHAQGFYRHLGFRADGARDTWRGLPVSRFRRANQSADGDR